MWHSIIKASRKTSHPLPKLIYFLKRFLRPVDERSDRMNVYYVTPHFLKTELPREWVLLTDGYIRLMRSIEDLSLIHI